MFSVCKCLLITVVVCMPLTAFSLSDPTRPTSYAAVAGKKENLRLESVFIGASRKVAVINGSVVAEGDSVDGIKVLKIKKNSVDVSRGGVNSTLKIKRTSIRQEN